MKQNKKAFTLVELLIVIAIIGILFIVLISRVDFATDKAKETGVQTDFRSFQTAFYSVATELQGFPIDKTELLEQTNKNLDPALKLVFEDNKIKSMKEDTWGNDYIFNYTRVHHTRGSVEMISAGIDQKYYTNDDYISTVTYALTHSGADVIITSTFDKDNFTTNDFYETLEMAEPGLYAAGSNYKNMIMSWDELVYQGIVNVNNGIVTTNYNVLNDTNTSATQLNGVLILPADGSVTTIGPNAFRKCEGIVEIFLPKIITTYKEGSFEGAQNIQKVFFTGSLEEWCNVDIELYDAHPCFYFGQLYLNGELLAGDITVPTSITELKPFIFFCAQHITSITIHDNVTFMGFDNFWGVPNLRNIYYEGTLEQWCDMNIDYNGNPCLYGGTLHIQGTPVINLVIPNTVTHLKPYFLDGCFSLQSVKIHSGVTKIDIDAFCSCVSLTDIYYEGTKSQWNNITFGSNWDNFIIQYTIHCTDGVIVVDKYN